MRGLIPLPVLVRFCPIGKLAQLISEWEDMYGAAWTDKMRGKGRGGRLQELILARFNGKPLRPKEIEIDGASRHKINAACVHLCNSGRLKRISNGVYIKT